MTQRRLRLAFAVAPILPSIFFVFALHLTNIRWMMFALILSISFSYLPCIVFGLPLIRFLERRNSLDVLRLTIGGLLLGCVVYYGFGFVMSVLLGSQKSILPSAGELTTGALLGAAVALVFGVIAGFPFLRSRR